jgi:hypothetical protein
MIVEVCVASLLQVLDRSLLETGESEAGDDGSVVGGGGQYF